MSSVVKIVPHDPPRLAPDEETSLRDLTRAAFQQRRKQFQRILRDAYALSVDAVAEVGREAEMDLVQRPETFSPQKFIDLARVLRAHAHPGDDG
jgi:16S rRNA A1518/A1519 N6-dimethyltransferase RsmA/KsgA/DIM1 with predicted DNA glycosylase/AP lyase activity